VGSGQRVGYIRVSSVGQNPGRQLDGVEVDRVFTDTVSGKSAARPQLQAIVSLADSCNLNAVTDVVSDNYEKLSLLLQGRDGWPPEVQDGERYWYFGVVGAASLTVTREGDGRVRDVPGR
jgi:hypothetical protein